MSPHTEQDTSSVKLSKSFWMSIFPGFVERAQLVPRPLCALIGHRTLRRFWVRDCSISYPEPFNFGSEHNQNGAPDVHIAFWRNSECLFGEPLICIYFNVSFSICFNFRMKTKNYVCCWSVGLMLLYRWRHRKLMTICLVTSHSATHAVAPLLFPVLSAKETLLLGAVVSRSSLDAEHGLWWLSVSLKSRWIRCLCLISFTWCVSFEPTRQVCTWSYLSAYGPRYSLWRQRMPSIQFHVLFQQEDLCKKLPGLRESWEE